MSPRLFRPFVFLAFFVSLALPHAAAAATRVVSPTLPCTLGDFYHTTISAAVGAAGSGDIILVCEAQYDEQVVINKSLTLKAAPGASPTIKYPATPNAACGPTDPCLAVVRVTGGTNVTATVQALTIAGPGPGGCNSIQSGIRVDTDAKAIIKDNEILDIHDTPFGGCQSGFGIMVGHQADNTTGRADILGNTITGYQKLGIRVDNTGSSATIMDNTVTGIGRTELIAQHGIQVSRGATVLPQNITGNKVTSHFFLNSSPNPYGTQSSGIAYIDAGQPGYEGPLNSSNTLRQNRPNTIVIPQ